MIKHNVIVLTEGAAAIDIYTLTIAISVVIFVLLGNYAGRNVKQLDDYFVAGRSAPTLLIVGTLVASVFSTTIFLGEAGFTYDGQLGPYILMPGVAAAGYVYGALFMGIYLRRSRAPTVADFFGRRFKSRRVQQAAGVTIILGLGGYLLVVTQGAAILLSDITALSYPLSLILAWLSYTVFTMYSGSKGVILTDTLMFLLFTFATIFFVGFLVGDLGGVSASVEGMTQIEGKKGIASWHGMIGEGTEWPTAMDFLIWVFVIDLSWGIVYAVGPWQSSRHLMAKNEHVVLRSALYTCMIVLVLQIMIYGAGGIINIANPDISPSETVIIWAAQNMVPEFLGAILLAGIVAAALSSASTFLSLVGFSVSNDVIPRKKELTLRTTRILMLVTGIIVLIAAWFFPPNIFWITLFIGTAFASSWGPVGFMSIWSKRITEAAAFWGIVTGFSFNVIPTAMVYLGWISLPSYFDPVIIGATVSLITILTLSRLGEVNPEAEAYRLQLHQTPNEDANSRKTKITLIAPVMLVLFGFTMSYLQLKYYVTPYQIGTGLIEAGDMPNLATGEARMALLWAVVQGSLGLISFFVIRKLYRPTAELEINESGAG